MHRFARSLAVGLLGATVVGTAAAPARAFALPDFGRLVELMLDARARGLFGFVRGLDRPADASDYVARESARAADRQLLAKGLRARFVSRRIAQAGDMIAFWPDAESYTHLLVCIEQDRSGTTPGGNGGLNASVQRVDVATGGVATILHGMEGCDGIRTTPWGSVLATEETGDGRAYEILDPLGTTGHWIADRAAGDVRDGIDSASPSTRIAQRPALPTMAWEGIAVLESGALIAGDELRPGSDGLLDADGGAIFKFVPELPFGGGAPIADLSESPFVAGRVFAFTASCQPRTSSSFPQYGQGCEVGEGAWVEVAALDARADADAKGATGYYRPEDLHRDPRFAGPGVRFCWTDTGNASAANYAEVMCAVDEQPLPNGVRTDARTGHVYLAHDGAWAVAVVSRFLEGDRRANAFDNLDFQPGSRNLYVIEDATHGEVWACLPDGEDRNLSSDGCVAMLSVVDPEAEPTGFAFDATGRRAFYVVQHGEQPEALLDFDSNPVNGETDDLVVIEGWKPVR
jgi:hypothetical protein